MNVDRRPAISLKLPCQGLALQRLESVAGFACARAECSEVTVGRFDIHRYQSWIGSPGAFVSTTHSKKSLKKTWPILPTTVFAPHELQRLQTRLRVHICSDGVVGITMELISRELQATAARVT